MLCALTLVSTTDLTFVRHGETVANATGVYNSHTIDTFSTKGQYQVDRLTRDLLGEQAYDIILVSPSPRALNTIAPYMKARRKQANVWPLLFECCSMRRPTNAHATSFSYGLKIAVPGNLLPQFTLLQNQFRYPAPKDYNEGLAQVNLSVAEFRRRYAGKRVLIVGHSGHGGQFLKALTGKAIRLENASPVRFKL